MPISSRSVVRSTFAFLIIGFVALLGIVGMTFWLSERAQVYFNQAIEARDTRGAAVELRNAVQTAESSQRGFMLTDNEIYLAPSDTAKTLAERQLAELTRLLAPYPDSAVPVQRLSTLIGQKFEELDQTIVLKRAHRDDDALAILKTNKGKALIDEANVFFTGIIRQADDRLTAGVDEQRNNAGWLRIASAIGTVVIVAVVGGAAWTIYQYTAELRETRDELNSLNTELERRVSERTADVSQARDRAEVLLREVNHRVANSLTLVSSLVSLQSKALQDETARKALAETQDRIFAISLLHRRLYGSNDARSVMLDEYLTGLLDHLKTSLKSGEQGSVLTYELAPVPLGTDAAVNLGVVVTEWVTNAFKYAYPGGSGEIRVRLAELPEAQLELVVEDDGVGRPEDAPAHGTGLGTRIVTAMATSLSGKVDYRARSPGLSAELVFPRASGGAPAQ
jgi:two-component sensor histidine kinase